MSPSGPFVKGLTNVTETLMTPLGKRDCGRAGAVLCSCVAQCSETRVACPQETP